MIRETRLANTGMISNIAVVLIAAVIGFLAFAIDKRELGWAFWSLIGFGVAILVFSIILGGRGVAKVESPGNLFDLQAKACLLGFLLLAGSLFFLGTPTKDDVATKLDNIQFRLGEITARLDRYDSELRSFETRLNQDLNELPKIRSEISDLRKEFSAEAEKSEPGRR